MVSHPLAFSLYDVANSLNVTHQPIQGFPMLTVLLSTCLNSLRDIDNHSIAVQEHKTVKPDHRNDSLNEDRSVADELAKKVRVMCMVMTNFTHNKARLPHIKATWGRRCDQLLYLSAKTTRRGNSLNVINLRVSNAGLDLLWRRTKAAYKYVYEHHRADADWFIQVDDDTYLVVENLRHMVSEHNSTDRVYFGGLVESFSLEDSVSERVGYVLSRGALDHFVQEMKHSPHLCLSGPEELTLAFCLNRIGVKAIDSRDSFGRDRFLPFVPRDRLIPGKDQNLRYWNYIYYPTDADEGLDFYSDHAVAIYYVYSREMYVLDFFIYHLRAYGIRYDVHSETNQSNVTKDRSAA